MHAVRTSLLPASEQVLVRTTGGVLRVQRGKTRGQETPPGRDRLAVDHPGAAGETLPMTQLLPDPAAHLLLLQAEAVTRRQLRLEALAACQLGSLATPTVDEGRNAMSSQPEEGGGLGQSQPLPKRRKQDLMSDDPREQPRPVEVGATTGPPNGALPSAPPKAPADLDPTPVCKGSPPSPQGGGNPVGDVSLSRGAPRRALGEPRRRKRWLLRPVPPAEAVARAPRTRHRRSSILLRMGWLRRPRKNGSKSQRAPQRGKRIGRPGAATKAWKEPGCPSRKSYPRPGRRARSCPK